LRDPVLPRLRLPREEPDPRLERHGLPEELAEGARPAARHLQPSGDHGPRLSRPCEAACTLAINLPAVTIRHLELQIVEHGWREEWIRPEPAGFSTGKRVAVVGSGPAGLPAAQQLVRSGHEVVVFEKSDRVGGLLRYGIPDFKLEKWVIDRRLDQLRAEGVVFETSVNAGVTSPRRTFAVPSTRSSWPPGRRRRATCLSREGLKGSTSRWSSSRSRTAETRGTRSPRGKRSPRRESTWW